MCTVTWVHTPDGYHLFANRDESLTRKPARPPTIDERAGVRYAAPTDGDAGGTWIAANEWGATLALVNDYQARERPGEYTSRGVLVREAAAARDVEEVGARLASAPLEAFRGFGLLALDAAGAVRLWRWDGERLHVQVDASGARPLVSSSLREVERVREVRTRLLGEMAHASGGLGPEVLEAYHRSERPEPGPLAVCMRREDARTVSGTWIRVAAEEVHVRYAPGPPAETPWGSPLVLPRRRGERAAARGARP